MMQRPAASKIPYTRSWGIALAFVTACISGAAIFVNSEYVTQVDDATVYTTAKNALAAFVLLGILAVSSWRRPEPAPKRLGTTRWMQLLALGAIGGSIPFILFFEGLARADSPVLAGFIHKTLVVWVALIAVPFLRERFTVLHGAAITFLIVGQIVLVGDLGALRLGSGELMVLAATLLWSVEFVLAKRVLRSVGSPVVGAARLGLGIVFLLGYVLATGRADDLFALPGEQWGWALVTGLLLAGFVGTWFAALARAQAVDVVAVLVFGQVVTAGLAAANGTTIRPALSGLAFLVLGVVIVCVAALRSQPATAAPA